VKSCAHRHPARCALVPLRPAISEEEKKKIALLPTFRPTPSSRSGTRLDLQDPLDAAPADARRDRLPQARHHPKPASSGRGKNCRGARAPQHEITVAMVGKYVDLADSYKSSTRRWFMRESMRAARSTSAMWIRKPSRRRHRALLKGVDAILVPEASASARGRHDQGDPVRAREQGAVSRHMLGMQLAVIEFARNVVGSRARTARNSTATLRTPDRARDRVAGPRRPDRAPRRKVRSGRDDAPGAQGAALEPGASRAKSTARTDQRAPPPPLRVNNQYVQRLKDKAARFRPDPARATVRDDRAAFASLADRLPVPSGVYVDAAYRPSLFAAFVEAALNTRRARPRLPSRHEALRI